MANSFRKFIQSIVYAGMTPDARQAQAATPHRSRWLAALDRFLATPAPSDPLYLTNRTLTQKLTRAFAILVPLVAVGLAIFLWFDLAPKKVKPVRELTAQEKAELVLPNFNKDIKLETNTDVQVLEVRFEHAGASVMTGSIRNQTDHLLHEAVVVMDLTDGTGSQLGGVTIRETDLKPGATREFKQTIEQKTATYAVVREVHTQ
jgi:hypothetical protein